MDTITVAGSGVLGTQIAFQSAFRGKTVRVYDVSEEAIAALDSKWQALGKVYIKEVNATQDEIDAAVGRLSATTDLSVAAKGADLVIEAVPEDVAVKCAFFEKLSDVADPSTIFVTNSSTLLPSAIADATGRADRFLALHFGNRIWTHNTAEVMGHAGTDPEVVSQVVAFARSIGMVPLILHKEQPGYILNSLLVPWLTAAMDLAVNGVGTVEDIDRTWMIAHGVQHGPFAILDIIGLRTPYQIALAQAQQGNENAAKQAAWVKANYIDHNWIGIETGRGFYSYPNPAYAKPNFVKAVTIE